MSDLPTERSQVRYDAYQKHPVFGLIDRRKIRSINIILATHSPFVLSDVLSQRSLYLEEV